MSDYKAGQEIQVEFRLRLPADATYEQVMEWLEFQLDARGDLRLSNPLSDYEIYEASEVRVR